MDSTPHRPPPGATNRVDINEAAKLMSDPQKENFRARIEERGPDECWPWIGGRLPKGYGIASVGVTSVLAHRLAYVLAGGRIEEGEVVRHLCENRRCCNPAHLLAGTYAENEDDKTILPALARAAERDSAPRPRPTEKRLQWCMECGRSFLGYTPEDPCPTCRGIDARPAA